MKSKSFILINMYDIITIIIKKNFIMISYTPKIPKSIKNKKGQIEESELDYRAGITKVRGGWTKEKIKKELKHKSSTHSEQAFHREIAKYNTPSDVAENLLYHGSSRSISNLKPSIVLKNMDNFGGGYGEKYFGISLSRDRDIASNFTGVASHGNVAPVLIKRGAIIKKMPEIQDAGELDDIIIDLWKEGVDALIIGDHNSAHSEQEVVILNPKCITVGPTSSFQVYKKSKMPSFNTNEIELLWMNSSKKYKEIALETWNSLNEAFKAKHGRERDATKWSTKQNNLVGFHEHNVFLYEESKKENVIGFIKDKKSPKKNNKPKV